jgi:hypothetical protein
MGISFPMTYTIIPDGLNIYAPVSTDRRRLRLHIACRDNFSFLLCGEATSIRFPRRTISEISSTQLHFSFREPEFGLLSSLDCIFSFPLKGGALFVLHGKAYMSAEKKVPSWIPRPETKATDHLPGNLVEELISNEISRTVESEQTFEMKDKEQSNDISKEQINIVRVEDDDDEDDANDDSVQRQSMLPTNLQMSPPGKKFGLFRKWRPASDTDRSITSDRPTPEHGVGESGSVASYMKGFSGDTVGSAATSSSFRNKFMRMLSSGSSVGSTPRPPKPPPRPSLPRTAKGNDTRLPPRPPKAPKPSSEVNHPTTISSGVPKLEQDPTPTHRSISTLDTEEGTLEGGVPSVIYCFIKVNPFDDDDDDVDLNASHSSMGRFLHLPKALSKRFVKKKASPKLHIDDMDEESYLQTLVAL